MRVIILATGLLWAAVASAVDFDALDATEIDRDADALAADLAIRDDRDTTDTAIVASNTAANPALVVCAALSANGQTLGAAAMRVPGHGLRYLRASDVAKGADFVGQVHCRTRNQSIAASAFLAGPGGVTALPVRQTALHGALFIESTVVASF